MKSYTDLEQSKKLAEILTIESADMNWHELPSTGYFVRAFPYKHDNGSTEGIFPCWSLAALLRLMPFQIIENNNRFGFYQVKGFNKQGETYRFGYKTNDEFFLFKTPLYNDVIDAAFEMVCWLKKNKKI